MCISPSRIWLLWIGLSLTACSLPHKLKGANTAYARSDDMESEILYRESIQEEFLTKGEYEEARRHLAKIYARRALAVIEATTADTQDTQKALVALQTAAVQLNSVGVHEVVLQQLRESMRQTIARGWAEVEILRSGKHLAAALLEARSLMAWTTSPSKAHQDTLVSLEQETATAHLAKTAQAGELLGLKALHLEVARWAGSSQENEALRRLQSNTSMALEVEGEGCEDVKDISSDLDSSEGVHKIKIQIIASSCRPISQESSREENYVWSESSEVEVETPTYGIVYKEVVDKDCRTAGGRTFDSKGNIRCTHTAGVREQTGSTTSTKTITQVHNAVRTVRTLAFGHEIAGTVRGSWEGREFIAQFSVSKERSEEAYESNAGSKDFSAAHTAGRVRAEALTAATLDIRQQIEAIVMKRLALEVAAEKTVAEQIDDKARIQDARARLVFLGQGQVSELASLVELPDAIVTLALLGVALELPAELHRKNSAKLTALLWRAEPPKLQFRTQMGYRRLSLQQIPTQANRIANGFVYSGVLPFREATNTTVILGFRPDLEFNWTSYLGKRSSPAHIYDNGSKEGALAYGIGAGAALLYGYHANAFSLVLGARWFYTYAKIGDVQASANTLPLSIRLDIRFSTRFPLIAEVWGYDLAKGRSQYGGELRTSMGEGTFLYARLEQMEMAGRFGGINEDDVIDAGDITSQAMDIGFQFIF